MSEWKEYIFKDLFEIPLKNGLNKPSKVRGDGFRMINMKEIFGYNFIGDDTPMELVPLEEREKLFLHFGDLLFARQSLVASGAGKVSYFRGFLPTVFESHLIRCRINPYLSNSLFLYYLIKSPYGRGKIETIVEQTAAAGIRGSDLKELKFKIPDLPTQIAIAEILSSLDDKIELNNKINQELENLAQTLFKQWFIDFEFPNENGEPYKSSGGEMVESELGEIPKGWEISAIKDWGEIVCGKTPSKANKDFFGEDVLFIKIPDMHNNVFITKTEDGLSIIGAKSQKNKRLKKGSVILSSIATVGLVSIVSKDSQTNQQINAIVPIKEIYTNFLFLLLKTKTDDFKQLASGGSATLNMNTSTFKEYKILMPNHNTLDLFDSLVCCLFEKIYYLSTEIEELKKIRDTLLPKLISGELEITETPN